MPHQDVEDGLVGTVVLCLNRPDGPTHS
jgi:hypothetical protein